QADLDGNTARITIAADIAASKNILVCNAAGNHRSRPWGHLNFPADGDSVLAVGAVEGDSVLASFSSPGPTADGRKKPDIVTLGVGVLAANTGGGFSFMDGTSFSTPLVAGGAALALEHDSTMTAADLRNLIRANGNRASKPDNDYGYGLYNAARSADIIRIDSVAPITILADDVLSVPLTTSGRSPVIPALSAFNLPVGSRLIDYSDGTGLLEVCGSEDNLSSVRAGLVADVGYFADTTFVLIQTLPANGLQIFAAPNPFCDSVRIVVAPSAGRLSAITVFNIAGEQVWERVNSPALAADIISTWHGRNREGRVVAAGVYLVHVVTDHGTRMLKVLKTR
ncbi:MAG: S8 family peptidase, partial [Candidatus Zixiibacteriota bacterium]